MTTPVAQASPRPTAVFEARRLERDGRVSDDVTLILTAPVAIHDGNRSVLARASGWSFDPWSGRYRPNTTPVTYAAAVRYRRYRRSA